MANWEIIRELIPYILSALAFLISFATLIYQYLKWKKHEKKEEKQEERRIKEGKIRWFKDLYWKLFYILEQEEMNITDKSFSEGYNMLGIKKESYDSLNLLWKKAPIFISNNIKNKLHEILVEANPGYEVNCGDIEMYMINYNKTKNLLNKVIKILKKIDEVENYKKYLIKEVDDTR